jgi:23S rRNA-intervening sequence protein
MSKKIQRFEDLDVWKAAVECANLIYSLTSTGKFSMDFVLRDQIRRAAVSIFYCGGLRAGWQQGIL